MNIWVMIGLGVALSMDCFAVAVATSISLKRMHIGHALKMAFFFGTAQAVMPVLGWWGGLYFKNLIADVDHWVAFILLSAIGIKMIYESRQLEKAETLDPAHTGLLFALAIGTSIDALIVGVSLSVLDVSIVMPVILIGLTTFVLTLLGTFIGDRLGHWFEGKIEILGGIALIAIGLKILIAHLSGSAL